MSEKWTPDDVLRVLADPRNVLAGVIPREQWIAAGERVIGEVGARKYLEMLLDNVEATVRQVQGLEP